MPTAPSLNFTCLQDLSFSSGLLSSTQCAFCRYFSHGTVGDFYHHYIFFPAYKRTFNNNPSLHLFQELQILINLRHLLSQTNSNSISSDCIWISGIRQTQFSSNSNPIQPAIWATTTTHTRTKYHQHTMYPSSSPAQNQTQYNPRPTSILPAPFPCFYEWNKDLG